jgi:4-hydroxybenzoate polyprenyltransferase
VTAGRSRWSVLAVLRGPQWLHFALLPCASVYPALRADPAAALPRLALSVAVAALCLAYAYGINAVADRHGDRSAAKNPLAGVAIVPIEGWLLIVGCAALAQILALLLGGLTAGAALTSLLAGTVYSVGPRFKAIPIVSTTTNAAIFAPLLFVGHVDTHPDGLFTLMVTFVALLTQNQLVHEVVDRDEDRRCGVRTTAVAFGPRVSLFMSAALGLAAVAMLAATQATRASVVVAIVGLGLSAALTARVEPDRAARARRAHRLLSLGIGAAVLLALMVEQVPS